jgi:hypothetical protein
VAWADGEATSVRIAADRAGVCRVRSPWPEGARVEVGLAAREGDDLLVDVEAGGSFTLHRSQRPGARDPRALQPDP